MSLQPAQVVAPRRMVISRTRLTPETRSNSTSTPIVRSEGASRRRTLDNARGLRGQVRSRWFRRGAIVAGVSTNSRVERAITVTEPVALGEPR